MQRNASQPDSRSGLLFCSQPPAVSHHRPNLFCKACTQATSLVCPGPTRRKGMGAGPCPALAVHFQAFTPAQSAALVRITRVAPDLASPLHRPDTPSACSPTRAAGQPGEAGCDSPDTVPGPDHHAAQAGPHSPPEPPASELPDWGFQAAARAKTPAPT
ncbi:hypothetical protein NDU88_000369 [Pleurodeles waltl]|uniref:Uncharacterized protein n=1 Tax=Pleurodeles waltl TaxID=8319 RepID=A0AAV7NH20_PLEWA|nr:hypothetical protein NDU88_000369 [Pleurodeles waltl]